jgi:multidrug efflux pump subunit AcrA (membrane-fusion protein)
METSARRQRRTVERAAVRQHRELQKLHREMAKQSAQAQAAYEVEEFENYLDLLVSLHKDHGDAWDWDAIGHASPPVSPQPVTRNEAHARHELQAYQPGFFDRLFGTAKRHTAQLEVALVQAQNQDRAEYAKHVQAYEASYALWNYRRALAGRLLARDAGAYMEALQHSGAFDELTSFQTQVAIVEAEPAAIVLTCQTASTSPVPNEELKLTAAGKVSTKPMAMGRFWALHQDFVCSSALRAANEALAVLPIDRVVVNVGSVQTDTSTGHPALFTVLAVHLPRTTLRRLNLAQVDASDSMTNFPHRMKFKKSTGFEPVEAMTLQENWVSA